MDDLLGARQAGGPKLEFRLLGPLEVRRGGSIVGLGGGKPRALLTDLLLHLGQVVSIDRLIDDLWGEEAPETAAHAVEVYVSQLRKTLDPGRPAGHPSRILITSQPGYLLDVQPEQVDFVRFQRLVDEGRGAMAEGDPARAALALREALALWRGPAVADFTYEPFAQAEIALLEELRLGALEDRIEAELALGQHADLVGELEALVEAEPLRERARRLLMLALYRSGRQADALAAYQAARRMLADELAIEPSPELRALEAAILRQEDVLKAPTRAAVAADEVPAVANRKLATILFADIADSTALTERLDPESVHRVMTRYFDAVSAVVARHGGTVEKFVGDAVIAVFGVPVSHEDDAVRAARAALDAQAAIATLGEALRDGLNVDINVRIALESGEVFATGVAARDHFVTGDAVNVAARLQQWAAPGEIVVGEFAQRFLAHGAQLEPLGQLDLKGKNEPVTAFRLLGLSPSAPVFSRRLDVPLIGRERELGVLRSALESGIQGSTSRLVCVLGPAGIGKSRLSQELVRTAGDRVSVLAGRCLSYGEGITYWPLRTIVREGAGDVSREAIEASLAGEEAAAAIASNLAAAVGSGDGVPSAAEISWSFRRFCEALAGRRPVLLVFDDLHWAEPTFLELVEHMVDRSSGAPILVVCLARSELLEDHPRFLEGRSNAETLVPDPLLPTEMESLLDQLVGDLVLPPHAREHLVATAEGNPLFLEQLLVFVGEQGTVGPERTLPPTIQALLAARLDRLGPGERAVLERAAVIGKEFPDSALTSLLTPDAALTLRRHLRSLATRDFIEGVSSASFEETWRFRHALVQEAVYRATPKEARALLHERFADWLERRARERARELDELLGYHLEQAYRLHAELGPPDRHAKQLASDAGERLGTAGIRAWKRGDAPAAGNLLGRAAALLPDGDARRLELLCELGPALRAAGDAEQGDRTLKEAVAASSAAGDRRLELRAQIELAGLRLFSDPEGRSHELLELAADAIPTFEALGDDRSLGRAWLLKGFVHGGVQCRNAAWEEATRQALVHYERSRWPISTCLGQLAAALYYGPTSVVEAIRRCEGLLGDTAADPLGEANVLSFLGGLEAQAGRFEEARELVARARGSYEALGQIVSEATFCGAVVGDLELLAGDATAAVDALRSTCETLARANDLSTLSSREADLAEALYVQERYSEAEHWVALSEAHAGSDDRAAKLASGAVRAKLLARKGAIKQAEELGHETVRMAEQTDALNLHAKALLDLAVVLVLDGRGRAAVTLVEEAVRLYDLKGNVVSATTARSLLDKPMFA